MNKISGFIKQLVDNAPGILKSKRFFTAFASVCVMIAIAIRPELESQAPQLQASVVFIAGLLIHGYSAQDKASAEHGINKYVQ